MLHGVGGLHLGQGIGAGRGTGHNASRVDRVCPLCAHAICGGCSRLWRSQAPRLPPPPLQCTAGAAWPWPAPPPSPPFSALAWPGLATHHHHHHRHACGPVACTTPRLGAWRGGGGGQATFVPQLSRPGRRYIGLSLVPSPAPLQCTSMHARTHAHTHMRARTCASLLATPHSTHTVLSPPSLAPPPPPARFPPDRS